MKKKIIVWSLVLGWMGVIVWFSAQPASQSGDMSGKLVRMLMALMNRLVSGHELEFNQLQHFVRKNAHFFIYLVLGMLVLYAVRRQGKRGWVSMLLALGICAIFATTDEIHQIYVPGRSGQVSDVLLDCAGSGVGIVMYMIASSLRRKT